MKAMVLCAGYGTRLGDLTREIPKPMLLLEQHPILEYIVCQLVRHGFDEIALNLHFLPELIRDYFADGSRWQSRLTYSHEAELLGTAGGLKRMAPFFADGQPLLVHYGDVVTNQDFTAMLNFHRRRHALATLLVHRRSRSNSALCVDEEGCIRHFLERPTDAQWETVASPWVFSGIAICEPELLDLIPPATACDLPRDIFAKHAPSGRLFAFPLTGQRCAIDSPARLAEARAAAVQGCFRAS
jgi:mannose-1-phosphate guanylyltransferase/phosphomannomutase